MLTLHQLITRMKKANNVKCGIEFLDNEKVKLWWQFSFTRVYELTFTEHQLTVANHDFQRAMKQAEIDMKD